MTLRPLPKTVTPVPDELLCGWLIRLENANYCEVDELLAHIGIAVRHPATLDFEVDMATVEKIAIAARLDPETVKSLIFPPMSEAEALLKAHSRFNLVPIVPAVASRCGTGGGRGHSIVSCAALGFFRSSPFQIASSRPKSCFGARAAGQGISNSRLHPTVPPDSGAPCGQSPLPWPSRMSVGIQHSHYNTPDQA